jgi:hypothetical protein
MSAATLKDRLSRHLFDPFRIVLSNGDGYDVRHPEMAILLRNDIYVALPDSRDDLPERAAWCSLLHVAAVEPVTGAHKSGSGGNGAGSA